MPFITRGIARPAGAAALVLALGASEAGSAHVGSPDAACAKPVLHAVAPPTRAALPSGPASPSARDAPEASARVALGSGGRDLRLAGDLTGGVAARAAALLAENPQVERIHLTSDGGLTSEAGALGALVAARGLDTYVPDACASACTLVFARGRRRYLAVGARLGYHAPYVVGPRRRLHAVDPAPERAAYRAAGLPPGFVARVLAVPPARLWIPDAARLLAAGAVTEVVGLDRFPDSTLDADPSPRGARAAILRGLPVMRLVDADAIETAARSYSADYAAGVSEAASAANLRGFATAYMRRRFRAADDGVVRALGRWILGATHAGDLRGGRGCGALASGDLAALDEVLRSHGRSGSGLAPLLARIPGTSPDGPASLAKPILAAPILAGATSMAGVEECGVRIARVRRTLDLPARDAAAGLRALLLTEPPVGTASRAER